jgi:chemotaxis protein MotB
MRRRPQVKKKRHEPHEEHVDESWLIPYADLLTLLLALFIILFAMSKMDAKKYDQVMHSLNSAFSGGAGMFEMSNIVPMEIAPSDNQKKEDETKTEDSKTQSQNQALHEAQVQNQDLIELQKKLETFIQENGLTTQLETKLINGMLKITIRDYALFQSGSADIKPDAQKLAYNISQMLDKYVNYDVEVAGHSDNRPINTREFETNWDLSVKRSLNFMKILLMNNTKIDPSHFRSIGYGEYQPIDTNDTEEGRSKNRRVEVNIVRHINPADATIISP